MKKFIVCPGYVRSDDGNRHFITYNQLINLYNVNANNCVRYNPKKKNQDGLIYLEPKRNGDYSQFWSVYL